LAELTGESVEDRLKLLLSMAAMVAKETRLAEPSAALPDNIKVIVEDFRRLTLVADNALNETGDRAVKCRWRRALVARHSHPGDEIRELAFGRKQTRARFTDESVAR
jgi:hypothetical protein